MSQGPIHPLAFLRAWHKGLLAAGLGLAVALLVPLGLWEPRLLAGWLAAGLLYLGLTWGGLARLDAQRTRWRAQRYDPGARAIYILLTLTVWISLVGVLLVSDATPGMEGPRRWLHILLALGALTANWLLIQTLFALRYARRYYHAEAEGLAEGLDFPGTDQPSYEDFAYFAFVIGMTSQVADVPTTTLAMRRLVLLHGLVSFAFNLVVLALTINLLASAIA
jgi:uncharacterized membrane protein